MTTPSVSIGRTRLLPLAAIVIAVLAISLASAQKKDAPRKHGQSVYAVLAEAPEAARVRKNPFAGDARETAAGGKLFKQHCADCHGSNAGGSMRGANLLREEVQQASPGTLFWILTNGVVRHGMPVWSKLPEPERWQIVTYLQSLNRRTAKPVDTQ